MVSLYIVVDSKSSEKKLYEIFIPHVAAHWDEIGIQLVGEDQKSHLDAIKANHADDVIISCAEMFWLWFKSHLNANWQELIESLRSPAVQLHREEADVETMSTG